MARARDEEWKVKKKTKKNNKSRRKQWMVFGDERRKNREKENGIKSI